MATFRFSKNNNAESTSNKTTESKFKDVNEESKNFEDVKNKESKFFKKPDKDALNNESKIKTPEEPAKKVVNESPKSNEPFLLIFPGGEG